MTNERASERPDKSGVLTRGVRNYKKYARTRRRAGHLESAGTYYVAGACGYLMQFRRLPDDLTDPDVDPPAPNSVKLGFTMKYLLAGSLCYRIAGSLDRCRHHCSQGTSIVSDLLEEQMYSSAARIGLFHEIQGDFRLIGNYDDYDEAYRRAASKYKEVDNDLGWSMEGGFEDVIQIPVELAESVGMGVDEDRRNRIMYTSLEERIDYKRTKYPEIIDAVVEAGNWESEVL